MLILPILTPTPVRLCHKSRNPLFSGTLLPCFCYAGPSGASFLLRWPTLAWSLVQPPQPRSISHSQLLCLPSGMIHLETRLLYCIVFIHLYSASCSVHQSEALPVRETQREESSVERTKRGTWLTS